MTLAPHEKAALARAHNDVALRGLLDRLLAETDRDLRRLPTGLVDRGQGKALFLEELLDAMKASAEGKR